MAKRKFISKSQAIAMLPVTDMVHTFWLNRGVLMAGRKSRNDIIAIIKKGKPELAGEESISKGHALVVLVRGEPLFIQAVEV